MWRNRISHQATLQIEQQGKMVDSLAEELRRNEALGLRIF